jgi:hypothetical protein
MVSMLSQHARVGGRIEETEAEALVSPQREALTERCW